MIRDLVVPMTGTAGDANALAAAIALAASHDARLSVLQLIDFPLPVANPWGLSPDLAMASVYDQLREEGAASAARLRQRLEPETIGWEVRTVESMFVEPPRSTALHARYADLCVLPAAPPRSEADAVLIDAYFNALVFESGRPVLVVPPHRSMAFPLSHAVVAWQPTREATRALHDALPLLRNAGTVDVVMVDPVVGERRHGEEPGADIAAHLARHGIRANVVVLAGRGQTAAAALLRHAVESGAQLLVAGSYGHSKLREWALGGTTMELLDAIDVPTLFSH